MKSKSKKVRVFIDSATFEQYQKRTSSVLSALWKFRMVAPEEWTEWVVMSESDMAKIKKLAIKFESGKPY